MKFKAIVAITLSLSLLTACGANQHKENSSKSNDTNKMTLIKRRNKLTTLHSQIQKSK